MERISYFDAHSDALWFCAGNQTDASLVQDSNLRKSLGHVDFLRGQKFQRYAQVFALYLDAELIEKEQRWNECCRLHDYYLAQVKMHSDMAMHCHNGKEIDQAINEHKIACLLSVEGSELFDSDVEHISTISQWGVKFVNPVWNHYNGISGTNCDHCEEGLSDYGKVFVRELERNGILVDVSHISDKGFYDLAETLSGPMIASHSNSREVCSHKRNLTDEMFDIIVQKGGVVGFNYYLDFVGPNEEDPIRHIEHFLNRNGEKTLCLGGDLDGCEALCCGMDGLEDVPKLYKLLHSKGYSEELLEDLFWNNLRRIF